MLFLLLEEIGISISPRRYLAVKLPELLISSIFPSAIISPPCVPASGPISIILSAEFIISSSCSTTITVLPRSLSRFKTDIKRSLSLECKPIEGSSSIYIDPTSALPKEVARLIRCDSPPDKVLAFLLRFR